MTQIKLCYKLFTSLYLFIDKLFLEITNKINNIFKVTKSD